MISDIETGLQTKKTVYILDRNAGAMSGHHAHWFDRLTTALSAGKVSHETVASLAGEQNIGNSEWYARAIAIALKNDASQLLFTAGDEVLSAVFRHMWRLRTAGKPVHLFLFRMAKQPRRFGTLKLILKVAMLLLLKIGIRQCKLYVLQLPIGVPPRWHKRIGLISVLDSSGLEVGTLVGKASARKAYDGMVPDGHRVLLVIGMLGEGKHVDTLVEAWKRDEVSNASLVFVGEASDDIHRLLLEASREVSSLSYVPGRAADEDFDRFVEGADAVVALYRYSASSGVVLKSLASGTKVLVGGSTVFNRQLRGVIGVHLLDTVTVETIRAALADVLGRPCVPVVELGANTSQYFPGPLVASIRRLEG